MYLLHYSCKIISLLSEYWYQQFVTSNPYVCFNCFQHIKSFVTVGHHELLSSSIILSATSEVDSEAGSVHCASALIDSIYTL